LFYLYLYFVILFPGIRHHVRPWPKLCLFSFSIQCVTKCQPHVIRTVIDLFSVKVMRLQFFTQVNLQPVNSYTLLTSN